MSKLYPIHQLFDIQNFRYRKQIYHSQGTFFLINHSQFITMSGQRVEPRPIVTTRRSTMTMPLLKKNYK